MEKVSFRVPPQADGLPAKVFLRRFTPVTARLLVACKRTPGGMTRNGALLRSIDKVQVGDIVVLQFPGDDLPEGDGLPAAGQAVPFPLAWENESVWIVEKPPGMVVYPTPGHDGETLLQAFAGYAREKEIRAAFRPVYRLDRDTSGLLVLGKDRFSAAFLAKNLKKEYMAVCEGVLTQKGWIERAIDLAPGSRIRRCCPGRPGTGQYACTEFIPVCHDKSHTLVRFFLHTGRTHQIRVHMASIGHPLAGDDLYGGSRRLLSRQALHCRAVSFWTPEIGKKSACPPFFRQTYKMPFRGFLRRKKERRFHMPSMLTHKLFAEEAAEKLSFGMTEREKRARLWGAQGPDVLFFHRHMPLHKRGESISEWGHKMHTMPDPAPVIAQLQCCEQEKLGGEVGQAWRQGFLCHYLLDRTCHPFVLAWSKKRNERDPQQPVCYWHQEIEANLDTMMLRRERGLLPQEVSLRRVLPPLEGDAPIIAAHLKKIIFAAFSVEVPLSLILQAMNDAVLGVRLSNDRTGLKHHFFRRMERKKVWRISSRLLPMTEDPDADFANLEHEEWGAQGENEDFFALYDRALEESGHFFRLYASKDAQQVTTGLPFC